MKNLNLFISLISISLLLSACGGGGGSADNDLTEPQTRSVSVTSCSDSVYTDIQKGDILVKEEDSTTVDIIHNSDNSKKICVISGAAYLSRK